MLIGSSSLPTYDLLCGEIPIREISPDPTKTGGKDYSAIFKLRCLGRVRGSQMSRKGNRVSDITRPVCLTLEI